MSQGTNALGNQCPRLKLLSRCKEHTRYYEGEWVHAPGHNIVSTKMSGTGPRGSQPSMGFDEDGGAGVLEALSKLLGPIGFFMIILLCVGVCIVYHNAKTYRESEDHENYEIPEMTTTTTRRSRQRTQGYVVESPPPVPPVQTFQHEPKENLENQNAEVGLSDVERKGLLRLLTLIEPAEVIGLANVITRGQVEVDTSGEAIETILTHTSRPLDLIRRKNVTKEVIFKYLHAEKGPVRLKASENKAMHMARLLEYWQRLEAEKKEEEEEACNEEDGNEEFSLDIGNDSSEKEEEVENNTGIKINIEDATPLKEVGQPDFENIAGIKTNSENGKTSQKENDPKTDIMNQEESKEKQEKNENTFDDGNSLPFIDTDEDENTSKVPDITLNQKDNQPKVEDNVVLNDGAQRDANSGYKSGMKKFFQNVSEAQQGDKTDFSVESRYSDEDSEIKTILGSGQKKKKRESKYIINSDEEAQNKTKQNKSKVGKIPVLDTSESEFDESELSRAGFSNFAFDEKE